MVFDLTSNIKKNYFELFSQLLGTPTKLCVTHN